MQMAPCRWRLQMFFLGLDLCYQKSLVALLLPKALKMDRWFQLISVYYRRKGLDCFGQSIDVPYDCSSVSWMTNIQIRCSRVDCLGGLYNLGQSHTWIAWRSGFLS